MKRLHGLRLDRRPVAPACRARLTAGTACQRAAPPLDGPPACSPPGSCLCHRTGRLSSGPARRDARAVPTRLWPSRHLPAPQAGIGFSDQDCILSFLPLAHSFDRIIEELALCVGAHIGYWRGNVKLLMEDVAELRPTLFVAVPRILERVEDGGGWAGGGEGRGPHAALLAWAGRERGRSSPAGFPQRSNAALHPGVSCILLASPAPPRPGPALQPARPASPSP